MAMVNNCFNFAAPSDVQSETAIVGLRLRGESLFPGGF